MPDRLTVVFNDPDLYRRLKIRAAEEGVAMKQIIEAAVSAYLEAAPRSTVTPVPSALDWAAWDEFQARLDAIEEEPAPDASDVKAQLYGLPRRRLTREGWARMVAEEPAVYDAGEPGDDTAEAPR